MPKEVTAILVLTALFILFLLPNIRLLKINEAVVIERLGSFLKVIDKPGVFFLIPLFDRVVQKESLLPIEKTWVVIDSDTQIMYAYTYQIVDIKMFCYAATDPITFAEEKMAQRIQSGLDDLESIKDIWLDMGVNLLDFQKIEKNNF
ncbi:MAG: hypothetical protein WC992_05270 [Acholeplasmataceae bacterium]|jgi:regulator of protease activity HflC (stomatin/prohibitin superfamily)|nr:hypothetical protein [Acholeplasmataceae bacterium]